ncbi:MAG: hypothetical protein DF168_00914 [Candidatus Moanabacter tarae]|uniref:Major facilitator superfamily (MFS) profile domain-containing protein n=1 Tax=Candidatus Moanibacter tarae TaxID=2200854 RepID=A0A2Z4ALD7_9BACT|nr:MAG: hypothetical protein DF168_00914 [Candidatus Moanabacter tarae]|tara:strand:- start:801 stop:1997 length:1197 start_codon:yes stop_codon:yes gene_type:complete
MGQPAFTGSERNIMGLTGVGHLGCHLAMLTFPTVAISIASEEQLPLESVLGWSFLGYLLFGLGALPVGYLTDKLSAKWIVRVGVLGIGPAMMLVSLFPPGPLLALPLAIVGLFASLYHPAGLGLITRTTSLRGTALGINGLLGNIGIAGAPLVASLATLQWGWKGAYLAIGSFLLGLGILVSTLPIKETYSNQPTKVNEQNYPPNRLKLFLILLIAMMMGGLTYRAATVAHPAYFAEKISFLGYGTATSLVFAFGSLGQIIGGRVADRYDLRLLYLLFHGFTVPLVLCMAAISGAALLSVSGVFLFFSFGMQPIENSLVARLTPDRWRSTAYGIKFTVVFALGSLAVGAVKVIIENFSVGTVFLAMGATTFLTFVFASALYFYPSINSFLNRPEAGSR